MLHSPIGLEPEIDRVGPEIVLKRIQNVSIMNPIDPIAGPHTSS